MKNNTMQVANFLENFTLWQSTMQGTNQVFVPGLKVAHWWYLRSVCCYSEQGSTNKMKNKQHWQITLVHPCKINKKIHHDEAS